MIVVCDESYSMSVNADSEGNTREAWSKALALALADQARRSDRDFAYIGFSNADQQWQLDFPGGKTPIEKVLDLAEHFFAGGTHYERPLTMALDLVEKHLAEGRDRPDIVFITDDECRVSTDFVATFADARSRADARVYGIQIGSASMADALRSLCDRVIPVANLVSLPHRALTEAERTTVTARAPREPYDVARVGIGHTAPAPMTDRSDATGMVRSFKATPPRRASRVGSTGPTAPVPAREVRA